MYTWKCWHDTRYRFIFYLTLLLVVSVLTALSQAAVVHKDGTWHIQRDGSPQWVREIWRQTSVNVVAFGDFLIAIAGIGLGATGVGDEFKSGSLEFLLSRPRRRRHFVWTGWAVGAAEMLGILALSILVTYALLLYLTGSILTWRLWAAVPLLFVAGVIFYSLSYFMTVVTRSGRNGVNGALLVVVSYLLAWYELKMYWKIKLPSPFTAHLAWVADGKPSFPLWPMVGWSLTALALTLIAQLLFERAEI